MTLPAGAQLVRVQILGDRATRYGLKTAPSVCRVFGHNTIEIPDDVRRVTWLWCAGCGQPV